MKYCPKCEQEKSADEFSFSNKQKGIRQPYCRVCKNLDYKTKYSRKPEYIDRNHKRRRDNHQKVLEYKSQFSCIACPESDPICLDFHHLDPSEKEFNLTQSSFSWNRLKKEIEKCIVICSNCHRKLHAGKISIDRAIV